MRHPILLARFGRSEHAVSAIEFAVVAPVLMTLLLAGGQVVLYIDATRKVEQVATSISEMLSQTAPTSSSSTTATVNATDLNFGYDSSLVIFPYVLSDSKQRSIPWRSDLTVSFSSVSFTKLNSSCDGSADQSTCYSAKVDWTSTGTSASSYRPCGTTQSPVNDASSYDRLSLPRSLSGPGSVIAVDVSFTFVPTFGSKFVTPITIKRSAFVQPRYAAQIGFDDTNSDGIASKCA